MASTATHRRRLRLRRLRAPHRSRSGRARDRQARWRLGGRARRSTRSPYGSLRPSGDSLTSTFTGASARLYDPIWSSSQRRRRRPRSSGCRCSPAVFRRFTGYLAEMRPAVVVVHARAAGASRRAGRAPRPARFARRLRRDRLRHPQPLAARRHRRCSASPTSAAPRSCERRGHASGAVAVTGIPVRLQFTARVRPRRPRASTSGCRPTGASCLPSPARRCPAPTSASRSRSPSRCRRSRRCPSTSVAVVTRQRRRVRRGAAPALGGVRHHQRARPRLRRAHGAADGGVRRGARQARRARVRRVHRHGAATGARGSGRGAGARERHGAR